jgi:hypothetical protein
MRLAALLLVTLVPVSLAAQMIDVQPGARVRLTAPGVVAGQVEGLIATRTADSVVLLTSKPTSYRIALGSIKTLSVSQGKSRLKGAAKGSVWGAAIMLVMSAAISGDPSVRREGDTNTEPVSIPTFIASETMGGAMFGATIGAIIGSERWNSYETLPRVTVGTAGGRAGLSVAF